MLIVEDMAEKADDLVRFMKAEFVAEKDIQIARSPERLKGRYRRMRISCFSHRGGSTRCLRPR